MDVTGGNNERSILFQALMELRGQGKTLLRRTGTLALLVAASAAATAGAHAKPRAARSSDATGAATRRPTDRPPRSSRPPPLDQPPGADPPPLRPGVKGRAPPRPAAPRNRTQ